MDIPKEFKGKIYFYKNVAYGHLATSHMELSTDDYIYLGESQELHVKFNDQTEIKRRAVECMEEAKSKVLAAAHIKCEEIDGQIQSLLAITHDGGE